MSTLEELAYYCKLNNPVGALLLTGEWGCGKTYIVENDLKELLKDTHVIIRVSFFGIPTIEELHKMVKASWIHRVEEGIKRRIEDSISKGETIELDRITISDLNGYTDEEKAAYSIIKSARDSSYTMYEANRREYVHAMRSIPYEAFVHVSSKRYNCFDEEMAEATIDAYKAVDNPTKAQFPGYFEGMWQNYRHSFDIGKDGAEKSRVGFSKLKDGLEMLCEEYSDQPFKKRFTEAFVSVIDKLLESEEDTSEDQADE